MTASKGTVLVVDDSPDWRTMLKKLLEKEGYHVYVASGIGEALAYLRTRPFHVAVLDIRLDEADEINTEGLDLAEQLVAYMPELAVIMLTGYATPEIVQRALQPRGNGASIAYDLLQKHETSLILEHVDLAVRNAARVNPSLEINLQPPRKLQSPLNWQTITDGVKCLQALDSREAKAEITDLLCRIFWDKEGIVVAQLAGGHSSSEVLLVQPTVDGKRQTDVVVKLNERRKSEQESKNYQAYVQSYLGNARRTQQLHYRSTARLGGIAYSFVGTEASFFQHLGNVYADKDIDELNGILTNLFKDTCGAWYQNTMQGQEEVRSLGSDYKKWLRINSDAARQAMSGLIEDSDNAIEFANPKQPFSSDIQILESFTTLPNPLSYERSAFPFIGSYCYTHGDLHENNVLVDNYGQTWLIDFYYTGPSHPLRDFAMLESAIRYYLHKNDYSIPELLQWEEDVHAISDFRQQIELDLALESEPEILKATQAINHLRLLASEILPGPIDLQEYRIALYFHALKAMSLTEKLSFQQRIHAMLAAGVMANYFDQTVTKTG